MDTINVHPVGGDSASQISTESPISDKKAADVEIEAIDSNDFQDISDEKIIVPGENDVFIDSRLKDYPIPLVAKTVDLHSDPRWKPQWKVEERFNPTLICFGATWFPVYQTTNLMTSAAVSTFFMGYVYRYHPVWFRKYNYLLGVGLDCGTQLMQTVMVFRLNLPNAAFPNWWGNNAMAIDRCFAPENIPVNAVG
ncbi:uncharacterized protein EAE97_007450 [Botrytis byssoidea]|uniref:Uncharacterized protein n=1 Tax=Botrytis byssoidea TaxID=139641 RepID=A0A9P5LX98_9HELO|nr:uncharacterized protein EAE97_007450 [Botrytis byssoidea]KAF7939370.1 hypothetical protein EAE97_007450 [Botrytis byssoidea]